MLISQIAFSGHNRLCQRLNILEKCRNFAVQLRLSLSNFLKAIFGFVECSASREVVIFVFELHSQLPARFSESESVEFEFGAENWGRQQTRSSELTSKPSKAAFSALWRVFDDSFYCWLSDGHVTSKRSSTCSEEHKQQRFCVWK